MPAHPAPIGEFLVRVRRVGARRTIAASIGRFIVGTVAIGLVALAFVLLTERGDLGQLGTLLGVAALAVAVAVVGVRRWMLAYGSALLAARTIAQAQRTTPASLGHELLAATELDDERRVAAHQSRQLAGHYVGEIAGRIRELNPAHVVPPLAWGPFVRITITMVVLGFAITMTSGGRVAAQQLWLGTDGRPPEPPTPLWSSLEARLDYPSHTNRPPRTVPNPSGPLRAPVGTEITLSLRLTEPADAARLVVNYDAPEQAQAPAPTIVTLEPLGDRQWQGQFVLRSSGIWSVVVLDDDGDDIRQATNTSPPARLDVEVDAPPELELLPLPADQREPTEIESVDLRFRARDDFGLATATLVYELPDGTVSRLPAGDGAGRRSWQHRYTWDLGSVPIERRSEITYYLEIRDNDPGLGLVPLADPPGKPVRSARHKLTVRDEETEHAQNVESLRGIRDRAVDLLALRLTAPPFTENAATAGDGRRQTLLGEARHVHMLSQQLLTIVSDTVDALSIDRMVPERDVRVLVEVHRRLHALYRKEAAIHEDFPPGNENTRPQDIAWMLARLARHSATEVVQLEDDIIRLDDLVDGQIIADLDRLLARLQASQQKLLELLEKLAAGDESVRPQIDQLEQRIREDLRRLSAARAQLRKEVGNEYMNLDAFKAMEERVRHQNVQGSLERGATEDALRAARETLDEISALRDAVGERTAEGGDTRLSPEEEARMLLLRELSRLKDDQAQMTRASSGLERAWRDHVEQADPDAEPNVDESARAALDDLNKINDARLGREGRRGYEDAREHLEALERAASQTAAEPLAMFDAARHARRGLDQARAGAESSEREAKALDRLRRRVEALEQRLLERLPTPAQAFGDTQHEQARTAATGQRSLEQRLGELAQGDPARDLLPPEGKAALRSAERAMHDTAGSFDAPDPMNAGESSRDAVDAIAKAIESLRRGGAPPPSGAQAQDASTEAERDRSLRDALMEAMRENPPEGYDEPIERYYEELLQ